VLFPKFPHVLPSKNISTIRSLREKSSKNFSLKKFLLLVVLPSLSIMVTLLLAIEETNPPQPRL